MKPTDDASLDASLAERLAFEQLLADLSVTHANVPADRVIDEIEHGLGRLNAFLGFDRSTFWEFAPNGDRIALCSAAVDGVAPVPRGPAAERMDWLFNQVRDGQTVVLGSLPDDLPAEAADVREYVARFGIRSHLSIPLRVGGQIIGSIGFGAFRATRPWPEALVARLKVVGEVFAQALARSRAHAELAAAHEEIKRLNARLHAENVYLRQTAHAGSRERLASRSPSFRMVIEEIDRVAPTNATVLLLGETGTGKELLAEAIHGASGRSKRALVKVNCAALPATLIESELFGREKGAYTGALARQMGRFEIADGSTIFLDEVGELPLELQPKLLRVLQDGRFERVGSTQTIQVDVRLIAATNRDLAGAVSEGAFREDLYYRLNVFPIELPPLRERREDIAMLAWAFVKEFGEAMGRPVERIADESMAALEAYAWPGNVRELRNVIERAMILARDTTLHVSLGRTPARAPAGPAPGTLLDAERTLILRALEQTRWRIRGAGGAAERLGLKPTTLESRIQKLGLRRPG
jgi:transcriptional regulator with GAF, ATPase, and Fis domain